MWSVLASLEFAAADGFCREDTVNAAAQTIPGLKKTQICTEIEPANPRTATLAFLHDDYTVFLGVRCPLMFVILSTYVGFFRLPMFSFWGINC